MITSTLWLPDVLVYCENSDIACSAYANRLSYLLCRIFQCEYSGKTNLDYFAALESEKAESRVVRERFPDELKGRVLSSVQFRTSFLRSCLCRPCKS